ncbi:MAG: CsbD family protein [Verrucomicrobiaceae bacterium]|nr:MAG: CsbD family protein [Verrucomicrobiaceae bacterium]
MVDENRVSGSAKQMGGSIKEGVGNLTGDEKLKNEGTLDKVTGKIQNVVGSAKDTIKDAFGSKTDKQL